MGITPTPELAALLAGLLLFVASRGGPEAVAVGRPTRHRSARRTRLPEIPEPVAAAITNSDLVTRWRQSFADAGASPQTMKSEVHIGRHFVAYVKHRFRVAWWRATSSHLDAYLRRTRMVRGPGGVLTDTGQPLADITRYTQERTVMRLYAWAVTEGLLRVSPFARRRPMRMPAAPERYVPRSDIRRLLAADSQRTRVMVALINWAGFRAVSVALARLEDIRWHSAQIAVRGKGDRGAISEWLPLAPELAEILAAWVAGRPRTGPLIPSLRDPGRHLSAAYVDQLINAYMHANGVAETAHGIRHTAGKEIAAVDANPWAAQQFLVHKSMDTTLRHYLAGARRWAVEDAVTRRPPVSEEFEVMGVPAGPSPDRRLHGLGYRWGGHPTPVLGPGHEPARRRQPD